MSYQADSAMTIVNYHVSESLKTYMPMVSSTSSSLHDDDDHFLLDMNTIYTEGSKYRAANDKTKKRFTFDEECDDFDGNGWSNKPIKEWCQGDTINWLMSAASHMGQPYSSIQHSLAIPGKDLVLLTRRNFISQDSVYGGKLYDLLHSQRRSDISSRGASRHSACEDEDKNSSSSNISDSEDSIDLSNERHHSTRGRVQKQKGRPPSQGKIWEFISDLLKNPETCPSLIRWEDYSQAKFRFVQSSEVAKRWGSRNGNVKMTYDKFSRAIRYHYDSKTFLPVFDRLVYQFGPNAKGWQTDNPNFRR